MNKFKYLTPEQRERLFVLDRKMGDILADALGMVSLEMAQRGNWAVWYDWRGGYAKAYKVAVPE